MPESEKVDKAVEELEGTDVTEIDELSDEELEDAAGGLGDNTNCNNTKCCREVV